MFLGGYEVFFLEFWIIVFWIFEVGGRRGGK
jgi:hypothetical protein